MALLLSASALAVAIALAAQELDTPFHAERSEAATLLVGSAVGATVEPLDDPMARRLGIAAREQGLVVTSLATNGPAAQAGVRPGDVIVRIGRIRVASLDDAEAALEGTHVPIVLTLNRHAKYANVTLPISRASDGRGMEHGDDQ